MNDYLLKLVKVSLILCGVILIGYLTYNSFNNYKKEELSTKEKEVIESSRELLENYAIFSICEQSNFISDAYYESLLLSFSSLEFKKREEFLLRKLTSDIANKNMKIADSFGENFELICSGIFDENISEELSLDIELFIKNKSLLIDESKKEILQLKLDQLINELNKKFNL